MSCDAKMLRCFYFLGIIYYINSTFCYDYINDDVRQRAWQDGQHGADFERRKFRTHRRNMHGKRQHHPRRDSEQVAQFDVADFMQGFDNNAEANARRAVKIRKDYRKYSRNSKDYNNYENFENLFNLNTNDKMAESWADSLEDDQNILEAASTFKALTDSVNDNNVDYRFVITDDTTKEVVEHNSYPSKGMYDTNIFLRSPPVHHHEKKGVLKNIRIPFFSRNKSNSFVPTKDTKRMTSKNLKGRREDSVVNKAVTDANSQEINDDKDDLYISHTPSDSFNKNKRSYLEKLCPECKKKYVSNTKTILGNGEAAAAAKMVHNSRQFLNQIGGSKDKKDTVSLPDGGRERRQYLDEKERQLKELEEVARKVESVDVRPATTRKFNPRVF